jgi:hypothetical protein
MEMINCENLIGKVCKVITKYKTIAARLIDIEDGFLHLRYRNGDDAFVALNSVLYISPTMLQEFEAV